MVNNDGGVSINVIFPINILPPFHVEDSRLITRHAKVDLFTSIRNDRSDRWPNTFLVFPRHTDINII